MERTKSPTTAGWGDDAPRAERGPRLGDPLLRVVDAGLVGVICVAPFFFGGRHDLGRLVLVTLIGVTAVAWFARQAMLPARHPPGGWPRTIAPVLLLLAAALLVVQIVPLPPEWLAHVAPRSAELLPLWTPSGSDAVGGLAESGYSLGTWQTLSLTPHETTKSLAMLLSYSLLFVVVAGRIQQTADVERLLTWIAASAVAMAAFGVVQYFTSDGRFFWFYAHPHRSTTYDLSGAFTNRNHFASFLVLGIGPLIACLLRQAATAPAPHAAARRTRAGRKTLAAAAHQIATWALAAALAFVAFAVLLSRSRGGAIALLVAAAVLVAIYWSRRLVDSRAVYGLMGLAALVVGLLSLYGYDQVAQRLGTLTEGSIDEIDGNAGRRTVWTANVAAFQSHRLFGTGAGSHREIIPAYLGESFNTEFTHAENGYLQVATETGLLGAVLLAAGIGVLAAWCATCLRRAVEAADVRAFGAAAAGLTASLVHSCVDFVWYIPACMSITIVLAACVLRLSQLAGASEIRSKGHGAGSGPALGCQLSAVGQDVSPIADSRRATALSASDSLLPAPCPPLHSPGVRVLPRGRWLELAAASLVIGVWTVHVYVGPAVAAVYWDRYLVASVASSKLSQQQMTDLVANRPLSDSAGQAPLNDLMLRQLEQVVRWDPHSARARLRLAAKYMARFELLQQDAENAMGVAQIRDAALASSFASPAERDAWLQRAFGGNIEWLRRAAAEAHRAAELCPLQGEAYVYLADLCFLEGGGSQLAQAYLDQALRVRPHDGEVLFEVGKQELLAGDAAAAIARWQQCFATSGSHQWKIVYLLAGRIPAAMFLETFQPDWRMLRAVWTRYRESSDSQELEALLVYAAERAAIDAQSDRGLPPASIWFWQAGFYAELQRHAEALVCLERAHASDPRQYHVRYALASALQQAGRFAEAESHVRWCLARRPADKKLTNALVHITKQRHAQRERTPGNRVR